MTIQQKLHQIRIHTGKTQTELANELGVSFPTLNSWINGRSQPRPKAINKINILYSKYLGDTNIQADTLKQKIAQLKHWQHQFPHPFQLILSRQDLYNDFLLALTYHTNSIEGSTFSEPEVKLVLFDDFTIPNKSVREHQEAKNHQSALGFVMKYIRDNNSKINQETIQHIHQILMNGLIPNAGAYRHHSVRITGVHLPTSNYLSIEKHIIEFIAAFNQSRKTLLDQVKQLASTHAQFEQIHPFSDGNGRVGRLLLQILAFRYKLAPVIIQKERKQAYYTYLEEVQLNNNPIPLTSFIFDSLIEGYKLLNN